MALANRAAAYDIRPLWGVHEAITLLAEKCQLDAGRQPPRGCAVTYGGQIRELAGRRADLSYDDLQLAVRWPDDPVRQIRTLGIVNFGRRMTDSCEDRVRETPRIDEAGLLCASHFGRLQFFHAMTELRTDPTEVSRARILDWADLLYRIATGDVPASTNMCRYFREHPSDISAAFELANPARCNAGTAEEWTLATLFGWECGSLFQSDRCDQLSGVPQQVIATRTARGALLHLIQDSYSQSHAVRGPQATPFVPRIVCVAPTGFYSYLGQQGHADADHIPEIDASCLGGGPIDDPITASAMALHHMDRRTPPRDFACYLQNRVFGRRTIWANTAARFDCARS